MIRTLKCNCGSTLFSVVEYHRVPDVQDHSGLLCQDCGYEYYFIEITIDDEDGKLGVNEEATPLDDEDLNPE